MAESEIENTVKVQDIRQEYCNHLDTYRNANQFVGEKTSNTQALERVQTLSMGAWAVTWGPGGVAL